MNYLNLYANHPRSQDETVNLAIEANRQFAIICLNMVARDDDGVWRLHYLGEAARTHAIPPGEKNDRSLLFSRALNFIETQQAQFAAAGDAKLSDRYATLARYFHANEAGWLQI
jgi:hypothetical protein